MDQNEVDVMRSSYTVKFKKLDPRATIPRYLTPYSVGMDITIIEYEIIDISEVKLLPTGLALEMPLHFEAQVRPRSGLSLKYPNYFANSIGTIDPDYRGQIMIPFVNNTDEIVRLEAGDRMAQIVFAEVSRPIIEEVDELTNTERGTGGFGHTGL